MNTTINPIDEISNQTRSSLIQAAYRQTNARNRRNRRLKVTSISALALLSGKSVSGWPSGSAVDSEDTMRFSALTGVRPRIEIFKLEQAEEAYAKVMENRVRFRAVLVP